MKNHKNPAWILAALALATPVMADTDLAFHLGNTYSDNVLLLPEDGPDDNIGGAAMKLDFSGASTRYEASVRTALTYLYYFDHTLDSELLRGFAGDVNLAIVPGRVLWTFQENYGPVLEDPLSPDRPDNWSYDSYFSTGPDVQFGDVAGWHVIASGRYLRADYENTEVPPSEQLSGELTLAMPGTEHSERSLNVNARRVEQGLDEVLVDESTRQDYDIQEAYLRWSSSYSRTSYFVDAGGTALHDFGETTTAPLFRLGLDRALTPKLSVTATGGTQYSDNSARFSRLQNGSPDVDDSRSDVTRVTDPMQEDFIEATFEFRGTRTTAALRAAYNVLDFQHSSSPLAKQEYSDLTIEARRQISPRVYLNLDGTYAQRDYADISREDKDTYASLGVGWFLQADLSLQLTGRIQQRKSSDPTAEFTENSVQLEFIFAPISRKGERPRQKLQQRPLR